MAASPEQSSLGFVKLMTLFDQFGRMDSDLIRV